MPGADPPNCFRLRTEHFQNRIAVVIDDIDSDFTGFGFVKRVAHFEDALLFRDLSKISDT